jgi:hypothetical protein
MKRDKWGVVMEVWEGGIKRKEDNGRKTAIACG